MFGKHPRVVIPAWQAADVVAGVNFARDAGLELAARGGGHSAPGFGTSDGGVVIDLSQMRTVYADPKAGTARADGGADWSDFNSATHAYGLATTGGIVLTTGIAGLTLGGSIRYLARPSGLSVDNLRPSEVVSAEGRVLTASEQETPGLRRAPRSGRKAMEPFRAVAPVVAEMAGPMPYPALNTAFGALFPRASAATGRAASSPS